MDDTEVMNSLLSIRRYLLNELESGTLYSVSEQRETLARVDALEWALLSLMRWRRECTL